MSYRTLVLLFAVLCFAGFESQAQVPDLAIRYYEAGEKKLREGDWLAAADDFTKAIETNARLKQARSANKKTTNRNLFDGLQSEPSEINVSDPFTAFAYTNRGAARFYAGAFDLSIADYERALRIKPRLAQAYLGRGAARNAKGDREGAMLDYNRALEIDDRL